MGFALRSFRYFEAKTIEDTIKILSTYGNKAKILAGGTDLLVSIKKKERFHPYIVYVKNIPELNYIAYNENMLKIGASVTHAEIARSTLVTSKYQPLPIACNKIGTPQIRNMGTIGGNICQGGPSQDTIPSLLVLEAKLKLVGPKGKRILPISEFFIGPFQTSLMESELLTEIQIETPPTQSAALYKWITKRTVVDETLIGVACMIVSDSSNDVCKDIRIGLGSVGPTPFRAKRAEDLLRGKKIENKLVEEVSQVAADEIKPRSRGDYRIKMTKVLVRRTIEEIRQKLNSTNSNEPFL